MVRPTCVCWTLLGLGAFSGTAAAQIPYRSYAPPAGPTLPIQLDYFRPQSGVLDQYNQFVAPKENLANQLGTITQRQNTDFHAVDTALRESDRIRESRAAATGTSAGFMNYSHYFGGRGSPASPPRQTQRPTFRPTPLPGMPGINTGIGMGYGS
jgi:hypothetical protein